MCKVGFSFVIGQLLGLDTAYYLRLQSQAVLTRIEVLLMKKTLIAICCLRMNVSAMRRAGLRTKHYQIMTNDIKTLETSIVYNEDCVQGLKRFSDKHFDLAIVDPPYGIGLGKKKTIGKRGKTHTITNYKQGDWDSCIPSEEYFNELMRVSKNQIIWGGNYFIDYLTNTRCVLFWSKQYIPAGFSMADCEMAWTSFNASAKMVRVPIEHNCVSNNPKRALLYAKIHQAQKPIGLYDWLIQQFASVGNLILDTHVGSGSSRIACEKAGLSFTGFEIDKDYYEAQEKRFKNHMMQRRLF